MKDRNTQDRIVVLGYGAVGRATVQRLLKSGWRVRVAQRDRPKDLPASVEFAACDALDQASVIAACAGADQIVSALGFEYTSAVWKRNWPIAMANLIAAARSASARVVFIDNLYMYGPQNRPLVETLPLTDFGVKPAVRAAITRQWMAAVAEGGLHFAALRAPDFYGPGVETSHLGNDVFRAIAQGKPVQMLLKPDVPHAFAYVGDFARAAESLLAAPDDAFGQAWHVPSAPAQTPRQVLQIAASALGQKLKIQAVPLPLVPLLSLFVPQLRSLSEMRFLLDRPYEVDASKFAGRFWADATPLTVGVQQTVQALNAP